ncbi:hypothetical protein ACIGHG_23115 [Bacillus sp. NPDC077411]|uniref:hypothetical protein n=1 Tax=Bacillus sp. NPDC077411 TaxID=3363947 RepID=UPI0037C89A63
MKERHKNPLSFEVGESIWPCIEAGRAFFYHMQSLKQREKASSGHVVFCIAELDKDVEKLEWIYIIEDGLN